jgi:short-subunit dehydrogenase
MRVSGHRVLLTGASSGIGRALARVLASRGARLAVAARRRRLLEGLATEIAAGGRERPAVLVADLAQPRAAARLATDALEALGGVDILVNNAGGGVGGSVWRVGDRAEAREAFEINLWSPLALAGALVPAMRERGGGAVVNVTSLAQVMPVWGMGHYAASKAALAQATVALRMELQGSGVHVLEVIPGPTDTAVQGETRLIPGVERLLARAPLGDPDELARLIANALERGRKTLVYPRSLAPLYALPPLYRLYSIRVARRLVGEIADDPRVIRSGSQGDPLVRRAREQWEHRPPARPRRMTTSRRCDD